MRCPYCNATIQTNSTFCDICGQDISSKSVADVNTREYWNKYRNATEAELHNAQKRVEKKRAEQKRIRKIKITIILIMLSFLLALVLFLFNINVLKPRRQYNNALSLFNSGEYQNAAEIFIALGDYKDSEQQVERCNEMLIEEQYLSAITEYNQGNYSNAFDLFRQLGEYKDSRKYIQLCYAEIEQGLQPRFLWDFSVSLSEQNNTQSQVYGNVTIVPIDNGPVSNAAYFDGDGDYIECGRGINITDSFTLNILLCCQDVNKSYSAIFAKYENRGPYAISINKGHANIWLTDNSAFHKEIESSTTLIEGEWYYITLVREGDIFKLYVNGSLEAEETWSNVRQGDDMVTIGRQAYMFSPEDQLQYTGYIGQISIFEHALSSIEVEAIHSILHQVS